MEEKKKRIFISMPMSGIPDEVVLERINAVRHKLEVRGYEVVDSFIKDPAPEGVNESIWYLSKSLAILSTCDSAYFCNGWNGRKGCRCEHRVAIEYNLENFYEEDE